MLPGTQDDAAGDDTDEDDGDGDGENGEEQEEDDGDFLSDFPDDTTVCAPLVSLASYHLCSPP